MYKMYLLHSSQLFVVLSLFSMVSLSPIPVPMQENAIVSSVVGDISGTTRRLHYFDPPPFYQYDNVNGGGNIHRPLTRYFLVKRSTPLQIPEDYARRPYKGHGAGRHWDRDEIRQSGYHDCNYSISH